MAGLAAENAEQATVMMDATYLKEHCRDSPVQYDKRRYERRNRIDIMLAAGTALSLPVPSAGPVAVRKTGTTRRQPGRAQPAILNELAVADAAAGLKSIEDTGPCGL
jgi:hypothetical protein